MRVVAFMAANMALAVSAADDDAACGTNVREASVGVMRRGAAAGAAVGAAAGAVAATGAVRTGTDARDISHTESGDEYKKEVTNLVVDRIGAVTPAILHSVR